MPLSIALELATDENIQKIVARSGNVPLGEQIANLSIHEAFVRTFGILGSEFLGPKFDRKNEGFFGKGKQAKLQDDARNQLISVDRLIRNLLIESRRGTDLDPRVAQLGRIINGVAVGGDVAFRGKFFKASNFDIDRPSKSKREIAERIKAIELLPPHFKQRIRSGEIFGNRLDVLIETALQGGVFDIGNVANAISFDEALRIAQLERQLGLTGFGTNDERNQSIANAIAFHGQGFLSKAATNDRNSFVHQLLRNLPTQSRGNLNTNFFGTGFFKSTGATAAFQVANVGTPPHILQRIAAQDAYAKSLDSILPQVFARFLHGGNIGFRLNRSQANALKERDRRRPRGSSFLDLIRPVLTLVTAIQTVTSSGVPVLTLDEARLYGNISEITSFITRIGRPRYEFELDRLRQHDADVERFNERLVAMSSGVGGF